jgi:hypothetical protein
VKILIKIPPEHYDLFVAECDITSREYSILKNAVVARDISDDKRVIEILCDTEEADRLLDLAKRRYPEVVPSIRAGLDPARAL